MLGPSDPSQGAGDGHARSSSHAQRVLKHILYLHSFLFVWKGFAGNIKSARPKQLSLHHRLLELQDARMEDCVLRTRVSWMPL